MKISRTLARYTTARTLRGMGASPSFGRALSLIVWPWKR